MILVTSYSMKENQMAYISQEEKKVIAKLLKENLKVAELNIL